MNPTTQRSLSIYLRLHLALMLAVSLIIWFPVFFVLYGGVQAVVLLHCLKKKSPNEFSISSRRLIYLFSLMEIVYTIALLYVGVFLVCNVFAICVFSLDFLQGTLFINPEFFHVMPGVYLNALYLPLTIIWLMVYAFRRNFVKVSKD